MAAAVKGGEQMPRCKEEDGKKRGRRKLLFGVLDNSA
jgi:hypothetical protein